MLRTISLFMLIFATGALAAEKALSVDRVVPGNIELAFPNDFNIQPEKSDFRINHFVVMSSEEGERWAVVTLTNEASGRRTFTHRHIMALLANGERKVPKEVSQSFMSGETLSLTIDFGVNTFPVLSVFTRHEA